MSCCSSSSHCKFYLCVSHCPLILGGNSHLMFGPHNTNYHQLEDHMRQCGLHPTTNQWNKPTIVGGDWTTSTNYWQGKILWYSHKIIKLVWRKEKFAVSNLVSNVHNWQICASLSFHASSVVNNLAMTCKQVLLSSYSSTWPIICTVYVCTNIC